VHSLVEAEILAELQPVCRERDGRGHQRASIAA
jgi:hypothetical protein